MELAFARVAHVEAFAMLWVITALRARGVAYSCCVPDQSSASGLACYKKQVLECVYIPDDILHPPWVLVTDWCAA